MRYSFELPPGTYRGVHVQNDPLGRGYQLVVHISDGRAAADAVKTVAPAGDPPAAGHPAAGAVLALLGRLPPDLPPELIELRVGHRAYRHGDDPFGPPAGYNAGAGPG